jgi:hypothetical protein
MATEANRVSMKLDRRVLWSFMAIMLAMNAITLFLPWKQIMAGRNDFAVFYSDAAMVREGRGSSLSDFEAESAFVRRVSDVTRPPNYHLPYEMLLFVPLTHLPFDKAYILWTIAGFGMLAGIAFLLRNLRGGGPGFSRAMLTVVGFFPVWFCLLQGQDSILLLFLFVLSFWLWRQGNDEMAGFILALGLFRPQLVLPFVFIALLAGKWKLVRGFVPGAALALALSAWVVGLHGMADYGRVLFAQGTQQSAVMLERKWAVNPGLMATWRGFLWVCLPTWIPTVLRTFLLFSGTFLGLGWAARKMWKAKSPAAFDVAFAIAVGTTLLVSFHSLPHDFSLMILPVLIGEPMLAASALVPKKGGYLLVVLGFLLFLTPLYIALGAIGNMAPFFLVGSAALLCVSQWANIGERGVVATPSAG